jgi:ubiquinone/menaquinone biosynthesis C-methylase UbiE
VNNPTPNYRTEYNRYWSSDDRCGESSTDRDRIAEQVIRCCGMSRTLDVGSGDGDLVAALLRRGADAEGVDVSDVVIARSSQRIAGRFIQGSVLSLPFQHGSFDTVISTNCLEHLAPSDVPAALAELYRVARRSVFRRIATTQDRNCHGQLTVEDRGWWETRCFEAGFRKHPAYYILNDYEALNQDGGQICVLLEKTPANGIVRFPRALLDQRRGLHMDMLRDTGERSDAHVIRYQWACRSIKPGDRVLDAACGLGYGARLVQHLSRAKEIVGIDASPYAIDYANACFAGSNDDATFRLGQLPDALSSLADGSFDVVVSFETLEHVGDPAALLREFHRLLVPGGRVVVSVPNDWSDETGRDPNPYHLQVYDYARLSRELGAQFIVEEAFAQTASQCKIRSRGGIWEKRARAMRKIDLGADPPPDCEWWLMVAMKSPISAGPGYRERVFANLAGTGHPSIGYAQSFRSPWLMNAMVNVSHRLRNGVELTRLAAQVMDWAPTQSNDHAAALCVTAYQVLGRRPKGTAEVLGVISHIEALVANPPSGAMGLRWKVSLLFVKARLLQTLGRLAEARRAFEECGRMDVAAFGIHLSTKVTEAWFQAGKIACAQGDAAAARSCWEQGVEYGNVLLSSSLDEILINRAFPNLFNHGDGVREYTLAWDNIARCANGLHLLRRGALIDACELESCFQTEYSVVVHDLLDARGHLAVSTDDLVATRQTLAERTAQLEHLLGDLSNRTTELVQTRDSLVERTRLLETANAALDQQAQDLVDVRNTLTERTRLLESANTALDQQSGELVDVRNSLAERTRLLEAANTALIQQSGELVDVRNTLTERTCMLESATTALCQRTDELVDTREMLAERTRLLEAASTALSQTARELTDTRDTLSERTGLLEATQSSLEQRSQELLEAHGNLARLTLLHEGTQSDFHQLTQDLRETRGDLSERIEQLASVGEQLAENAGALGRLEARLDSIARSPIAYALRATFRKLLK